MSPQERFYDSDAAAGDRTSHLADGVFQELRLHVKLDSAFRPVRCTCGWTQEVGGSNFDRHLAERISAKVEASS